MTLTHDFLVVFDLTFKCPSFEHFHTTGAGLVVLWAAAAACVPAMQKGNDTARSIHIGANVSGIGLFAWQITTGWPILQKVVQFTHWP